MPRLDPEFPVSAERTRRVLIERAVCAHFLGRITAHTCVPFPCFSISPGRSARARVRAARFGSSPSSIDLPRERTQQNDLAMTMTPLEPLHGKTRRACNRSSNARPSRAHTRGKWVFYRSLTYDNHLAPALPGITCLPALPLATYITAHLDIKVNSRSDTPCVCMRRQRPRILGAYLALNVSARHRFSSSVDIRRARGISHTRSLTKIDRMLSGNEHFAQRCLFPANILDVKYAIVICTFDVDGLHLNRRR